MNKFLTGLFYNAKINECVDPQGIFPAGSVSKGETAMPGRLKTSHKVVGAKQKLKALENGQARLIYVAKDADRHVLQGIMELSNRSGIKIVEVATMAELGEACGIDVGAAVAGIID